MKSITIFIVFFVSIFTVSFLASAQTAERLTDKDVKDLMEKVDHGRDRFEDALDGKLKRATFRSATAEVDIGQFLDEFQNNVDLMKERFTNDYSASREAATILRQGSNVNTFMSGHPGIKGESEWHHLAADLKTLANVYGTDFPLPDGAAVRRINDKEAAMSAESLAKQADQLKKAIGKDKTLPKDVQEGYKREVEGLIKSAKEVKSRTSDSKPATAEVKEVIDQADQIGQSLQQNQMSPAIESAWNNMQPSLQKLASAFNMSIE